ncbi:RNA polymerase RpoN-/SigL-like sigma 54 subunit [Breoghania corrubedonensis]|uniref:RNA polymerase sigma-54 factor n=1 Tax=Breoghania corrubedonensis TaxID=665038 RepID=A0A2T5VFX9_9HYPH|nr:RNA polymerase factor sigma-54 [Breoghania corrubedonensis]PTW62660.1 RNA polymerase RpoN-/SigL-like sigma 54 subunit [Breoghania corrubedonensis]
MAIAPRLEVRQSQSLVMTPQLMQAIKLLQLSNLDLVAYVDAELERNPLLERSDSEDGSSPETSPQTSSESDAGEGGASEAAESGNSESGGGEGSAGEGSDWVDAQIEREPGTIAEKLDADFGNVYQDDTPSGTTDPGALAGDPWQQQGAGRGAASSEGYNLESFIAEDVSLSGYLGEQMALLITDPAERIIAGNLIDNLDDAGYLRTDVDEVAERLGAGPAQVESVLQRLQTLEPTGVFARNLAECLRLQLQEKDRYDPAMAALLDNIELLAKRDAAALKRLCHVDDEDLAEMICEIKALNPRPGSTFGAVVVQPMVPDVIVRPASDGGWSIELNSDNLPKVLVNQTYYATVQKTARNETEKAYLTDCLQTANWLVKSLDQRARTILKVATEIVRQQDAFLTYGVQHLRPLNLRTVADAIGMHESTVSRVTSNKYMATTRGIFELKYFFTSAIASSQGGDAHSAESVRHRIRQMIDQESPDAILSDDTLVTMLRQAGIDIARRTVAKYRESLRIPSSVQRRREKRG